MNEAVKGDTLEHVEFWGAVQLERALGMGSGVVQGSKSAEDLRPGGVEV